MRINIENMLRNAAIECDRAAYGQPLRELARNLKELRDRHRAGDLAAIEEFFSIYRFDFEDPFTEEPTHARAKSKKV